MYSREASLNPNFLCISGVYKGSTIFVKSVFDGVSGVVLKPIKGAKEKGFKGATVGVGKGIIGLVCKPIAGGIDMLTNTVRGIGNTPKSLYNGTKKMFKKDDYRKHNKNYKHPAIKPYIPGESNIKDIDELYVGSNDEGEIYVDKKELKRLLKASGYKKDSSKDSIFAQIDDQTGEPSEDLVRIIKEFIVKKGLTVIKRSKEEEVDDIDFYTCQDEEESQILASEDYEVFMLKPMEITPYDVESEEDRKMEGTISIISIDGSKYGDSNSELKNSHLSRTIEIQETPEEREKKAKRERIVKMAKNLKTLERSDDFRINDAHPIGGFALLDQEVIRKYRNVAKEAIKRVGSQLLRGKISLTSVSFPIK